jgi:hypothetical protein
VVNVVKSVSLSGVSRETDNRTHETTTDIKPGRLEAALAKIAAGMARKAERLTAAKGFSV